MRNWEGKRRGVSECDGSLLTVNIPAQPTRAPCNKITIKKNVKHELADLAEVAVFTHSKMSAGH